MKKRNVFLRASVLLLSLTTALTVVFMGSPAVAKYVATATSAASSARAAKFSFKFDPSGKNTEIINSATNTNSNVFDLPLFSKAYTNWGKTTASTTVSASTEVIAPGTGHFAVSVGNSYAATALSNERIQIDFKNESEVTVRMKLEYDEAATAAASSSGLTSSVPLLLYGQCINSGDSWGSGNGWSLISSNLVLSQEAGGNGWLLFTPGQTRTIDIGWAWIFSQNGVAGGADNGWQNTVANTDSADTALGKNGNNLQLNLKCKIFLEQVD